MLLRSSAAAITHMQQVVPNRRVIGERCSETRESRTRRMMSTSKRQ